MEKFLIIAYKILVLAIIFLICCFAGTGVYFNYHEHKIDLAAKKIRLARELREEKENQEFINKLEDGSKGR